MIQWSRPAGALVICWSAATLWALGLVGWQPAAGSGWRWTDGGMARIDAYWARDVRWGAILAVAGVLIALSGGNRRRSLYVLLGALTWVGFDVALDRVDLGRPVLIPALFACAVTTPAVLAMHLRPGVPSRFPATAAAAACATTAMVVAALHAPPGSESALGAARLVASALLITVALACALAAAPAPAAGRLPAAVAVGGVAYALVAGPDNTVARLAGVVLLLAGVWALSRRWLGWRNAAGGVAGIAAGFPVLAFVIALATMDAGRPFTALAGNLAVSPADSDMLNTFTGLLIGLTFATTRLVQGAIRAELRRPQPAVTALPAR